MFTLTDWFRLFMSALIILPIVTVIRESGYYLVATILKGENKNLIIGSGPTLFKIPTVEVRRYFFMFSWMEYENVNPKNRFWHGLLYAAPILTTGTFALVANSLVMEGVLANNIFWTTFIFYCFYYMLFDIIPVYLPDGQPTNGRAIFDLIWHGERSDYKKQRLEREKQEEMELEEDVNPKEAQKEEAEDKEERSYTQAQEETMENRDRDDEEREDHTRPEAEGSSKQEENENKEDHQHSYTDAQEETKENRDRDAQERGDHTDPNK